MTWTAPPIEREPEPTVGDERTLLEGWLDWHRQTLLTKCAGLTAGQLKLRAVEPSTLSLLGLVRHMSDVERSWFVRRLAGEDLPPIYYTDDRPNDDFDALDSAGAEEVFATFHAEVERARRAAAGRSLDETFVHSRTKAEHNLRWVYLHMIEEYARHNGHADLLRERIDGSTGD